MLAKPVYLADEAHHELVGRMVVKVVGAAGLLHPALVHHHQLSGDVHRLLLVVGDEDRRHVHLVVQVAQPGAQVLAHLGVEGTEGLVEQQHLRLDRQRPCQCHPLALAAGELGRVTVGEPVELDEAQQLVHPVGDLRLVPLADLQAEADFALLRRLFRDVLAIDQDTAGIERLEPGDRPQQGRLAAATRPEQGGQRAVRNIYRYVIEGLKVTEALRSSLDCDSHQASSFLFRTFIARRVVSAKRANRTEAP